MRKEHHIAVFVHSISTALPPYCLSRDDVKDRAEVIFKGKYTQFERLSKTYDTAGIDKRYSVEPIDWFLQDHGWTDRNAAFMTGAKDLFIKAADIALKNAGWIGADMD